MNDIQRFSGVTEEIDLWYHEAALRLGLSDSSISVLYSLLCEEGECEISKICLQSGLCKQTINSALRKLEKEGHIGLKTGKGKNKIAFLTDSGKQEAERTAGRIMKIEEKILNRWTKEEIKLYLELSQRFLDDFKEEVKKL